MHQLSFEKYEKNLFYSETYNWKIIFTVFMLTIKHGKIFYICKYFTSK